ncbi:hypothetical protein [Alicyclobacillus dauci]|uniref:Uncharacterized protein n=1 Tax=Alicyclobacillus dauci TaxID=1475485 RepID=A0ABY6Z0J8_9BACL|nr:hypothetical protein [Alicyclobacillus dauci]WAH36398.1 hypothetical protein NZD86_19585 [Alicyclobacillus dauci]
MERFEQEIAEIKATASLSQLDSQASVQTSTSTSSDILLDLQHVFNELANQAKRADSDLEVKVTGGSTPGMTAGFLNSHFNTPRFIVKTQFTGDTVQLNVTDGDWQEAGNQHGLWGNWVDESVVYHGKFDDVLIRSALEKAFLTWYKHIRLNDSPGIPMS